MIKFLDNILNLWVVAAAIVCVYFAYNFGKINGSFEQALVDNKKIRNCMSVIYEGR